MRILIAEDDPISRRMLTSLLSRSGYEVVAVEGGVKAWEILQAEDAPRLALLDWMMPVATSRAVLECAAHALKGSIGNFGASAAAAAALRLEQMGRQCDLAQAEEACAALDREIERLKPILGGLCQEVPR